MSRVPTLSHAPSLSVIDTQCPWHLAPHREPPTTPVSVRQVPRCPDAPLRNTGRARVFMSNFSERERLAAEALVKLEHTKKIEDRKARYGVHESAILEDIRERVPSSKYGFWF